MTQLRDVLLGLRPQIPEALLAGQGWDRLLRRVGALPAAAASPCGFELRLGNPDPAADFCVSVAADQVAQHYIAQGQRADPASAEAWLSRHLANRNSADGWIDAVLLGYDLAEVSVERQTTPPPAVNLKLAPRHRLHSAGFTPDLLARALAHASGRSGHRDERSAVRRAFEALPRGASVVFAAAAADRKPKSVKLIVSKIPASEAGAFVDRLGWSGSIPTMSRLLSMMQDVSSRFMISVDLDARRALPRLGLEMYPDYSDSADDDALLSTWLRTKRADWRGFVNRLVDMRLCLPAKAQGLLSWPGWKFPYGQASVCRLWMGINHVKISISGERLQAKAYAGLEILPRAMAKVV